MAPILFLVFNRLSTTKEVFSAIRAAKPEKLYIAADGPRAHRQGEAESCSEVRKYVLDSIDWPCSVSTNFQTNNLGCGRAVSTAITWFFEHEESGIILEDDCLPHPAFFDYCSELLIKYKDDSRVSMISGVNFGKAKQQIQNSYTFSPYSHIWGWATWHRAWKDYDFQIKEFSSLESIKIIKKRFSKIEFNYWMEKFNSVFTASVDTWDYQWVFCNFIKNRLSIMPKANLISNIGFGPLATHTTGNSTEANLPYGNFSLPLIHPLKIKADKETIALTRKGLGLVYPKFHPRRVFNKLLQMVVSKS